MLARAGGYYGAAFKGDWGVTQGDLLSPTIFNVMLDVVLRHWVTLMVEGAEETKGVYKRVGIRMPSSTHTMAWFNFRTRDDSRVNLVPWSTCSIGWACRPILGRQSAWSDAHARRRGPSRRWHMGDG